MSSIIQPNYGARTYDVPTKARETKKASGESKTGTEAPVRRTASDELSYLSEKYECLKCPGYSVKINGSLLAKATSDEKTSEWLEYNLSLIPNVVDNLKSAAAARGSKVISCNISINGYDSMTTEMVTQSEADPGIEEMREELEEHIQKKREEKKAQEKQKAKRSEKRKTEEKQPVKKTVEKFETHTVTITGTSAENLTKQLIDKITSDPRTLSAFDVKV